ncbi:MAG: type II toxin-antitoxin system prevent-host-death family antitoxin [Bacteroidales bacterium]|nr:type II toxin-antitoxin system prevent-host-death family antitoxin [Bacteroidales bacterium]
MVVVTSRDFRANQSKYFDIARRQDLVIVSKSKGSFKLIPVSQDDTLIDKKVLYAKIEKGIREQAEQQGIAMKEKESGEEFINRMLCSIK